MTTKEKLKAYDKAIEKASQFHNENCDACKMCLESIFDELNESERIRKELITFIKKRDRSGCDYDYDKWIAWLEKQGAQKPTIEPKFKNGDWVVCEVTGSVCQIKNCIENLSNHRYGYDLTNGGYIGSDEVNHYHLWTIQDAKDGDVLVINSNITFIFKFLDEGGTIAFRTACTKNSEAYFPKLKERLFYQDVYPATQEQRALLFQKIKEAGYVWNTEKKELRKRETSPVLSNSIKTGKKWTEEDERHKNTIIRAIHGAGNITPIDGELAEKWLKSIKQRWRNNNDTRI